MALSPKIRIRGIRQPIPNGYVLGRRSAGSGQPELVSISDLGQQLSSGGAVSGGGGSAILGPVADKTLLANISGSTTQPTAHTLTAALDNIISSTQGSVIYRGASAWAALGPGTSGQFLKTQGAAANPAWASGSGGLWGPALSNLPTKAGTGFTTQVNAGSATFNDRVTGVSISAPANAGDSMRILSQTAPATPYTRTALLALSARAVNVYLAGIGWSDGTKLHVLDIAFSGSFIAEVTRWSNATTYVAVEAAASDALVSIPVWLQLTDDGTNVTFGYSYSGDTNDFVTLFTVAKASGYLGGSGYTNLIFFANHNGASPASPAIGTLMSWA